MKCKLQFRWLVSALIVALPINLSAAVLSHWRFDETSGLVAVDSAGTVANDGTWQDESGDGLTWVPGVVGNAAQFEGTAGANYFFNTTSGIEADNVTQLSYAMWVKPNLVQDGDDINKGIFNSGSAVAERSDGMGGGTTHNNQFWAVSWISDRNWRSDNTGTTVINDVYDGTETEPEWLHLAWTWDGEAGNPASGDEIVKLYIDGVLATEVTNRNVSRLIEDGNWFIGGDRGNVNRNWGGAIDDLAVWDQVLTDTEIQMIYNEGLLGTDAVSALNPGKLGDVNGDMLVNSLDFEIIRSNFWQDFTERTDGDLVDNDFIDIRDYAQWKQADKDPNPALAAAGGATVPEPSSAFLALLTIGGLGCMRRLRG